MDIADAAKKMPDMKENEYFEQSKDLYRIHK